jgi:hypothetical protein
MSEYQLKDKHIIYKDGFVSTCPKIPVLAIPRMKPNDSKDNNFIPFDKVRFPCSLTCQQLEMKVITKPDGHTKTKIRTNCVKHNYWHVLAPEKEIVPEVVEAVEVTGKEPDKDTIKLNPK